MTKFTEWQSLTYMPPTIEILVGWPGNACYVDVAILTDGELVIRDTILANEKIKPPTHWMPVPLVDDKRWVRNAIYPEVIRQAGFWPGGPFHDPDESLPSIPINKELLAGWSDTPMFVDFLTWHQRHGMEAPKATCRHSGVLDRASMPDMWMQLPEVPS